MKLVLKTAVFHIFCILIFSIAYFLYKDHFTSTVDGMKQNYNEFADFLNLSITIQSGVGMTYIIPNTLNVKCIMMIQQCLVLLTHVITIYVFTI